MKKTLLALTCFCSLLLYGCASKPENAPELNSQTEELTPQTSEFEDNTQNSSINETTDSQETENIESEENNVDLSLSLEEIEEPVVITLEPEEISEPEQEDISLNTEQNPQEEPIEVETPPVIEEISIAEDEKTQAAPAAETETASSSAQENTTITVKDSNEDKVISAENQNSAEDDIIDVTDDSDEDTAKDEPLEEIEIIPSRKVTVKKGEYIDITYPGNGWIYMGLVDGSKDFTYFGRKLGTGDTKFTLQAKNSGTKIVHFYKNDQLTGQYIDDYVEVEVLSEKGSNKTHIQAPAYKQPVPAKAKEIFKAKVPDTTPPELNTAEQQPAQKTPAVSEQETPSADKETVKDKTGTNNKPVDVEKPVALGMPLEQTEKSEEKALEQLPSFDENTLLKEVELLYNEKEYKLALDKLNIFFENTTTKRDKALFLKGQILESKSSVQDIKGALEAYNTLIKNYPASLLWDDANKRVIYLKRFYFGG